MGTGPGAPLPTCAPLPLRCPRGQAGSRFPAPLFLPERETAEGEHLDRGSSSPANTRRGSQEVPMDAAEEPRGQDPPNAGVCLSSCRHCFCFPCIQEWARRRALCPRCREFVNHIFPMRDGCIHEDHEEGRGRPLHRRSDGSRPCLPGRRDGSSSRRARGRGWGSARSRSRSRRWHRNNRRWSRRSWNRRRFRSMAWGIDHNVGQDLPPERAIPGNPRWRSRQQPGMRRRLHRHRGQGRGQRSRGWYEQQALHPSLDAPVPPGRGERRQQRGSSRNRRRSRQGQRSRARRRTV